MHPLPVFFLTLSIFFLQTTANTQQDWPRVYATMVDGIEVINLNVPKISLAYVSNLVLNTFPQENVYTLYFLADMGTPNIYTSQFIPEDISHGFWSTGRSDLYNVQSMPFFSFDAYKNNIVGPSFPNNNTFTLDPVAKFVIQSVYINPIPQIFQDSSESFVFSSTLIDPQPRSGTTYVYFAGWGNSGFVVARATINLDSTTPYINFDPVQGVLVIPMRVNCYDQFNSISRPIMKITNTALFLVVPGRCGFFAEIPLPSEDVPWMSIPISSISTYNPRDSLTTLHYVSSALISPQNDSTIYYAVKSYNQHGAYLFSFDTLLWTPNSATLNVDDIGEGEALLAFGDDEKENYIFLLAAGSDKIKRYTIGEKNTLLIDAYANLYPTITQVSSALYFNPHLYFTTYEPDAKLARVPMNNFCKNFCGDNAFCNKGTCSCSVGYSVDDSSHSFSCILSSIASLRYQEKSTEGGTAALGVFFAFSLLAALAGWGLWWKERKLGYVAM